MITCEVKRVNRDKEMQTILQWDADNKITSKHYKAAVRAAFLAAAESYENDCLSILIYDGDFRHVLKLIAETYSSCSYIWMDLYEWGCSKLIKRMYIAC